MTIATVDFSAFNVAEGLLAGEAATQAQLTAARQIDDALRTHGFVQLVHIGVPENLRRAAFEHMRALFALPEEHKDSQLTKVHPYDRNGFKPFRSQAVNKARAADLNESFNVLPPELEWKNDFAGCPAAFGPGMMAFWHEVERLASRFAMALALAAEVPSDYFARTLRPWMMRLNHYPPCADEEATGAFSSQQAIRIGEHTDFGGFTLLFLGPGATGLQISPIDGGEVCKVGTADAGGWVEVQPAAEEDCVIVNTGSLLAQWTNDVWRATAHRVVVPDAESARMHRYSMACFIDPDPGARIEVHPQFVRDGERPKYAAVHAGEHRRRLVAELNKPPAVVCGPRAAEAVAAVAAEDEDDEDEDEDEAEGENEYEDEDEDEEASGTSK